MRTLKAVSGALLIGLALCAGGCSSETKVDARTTTVGGELKDLDEARDKGLLTEDEYQKKRREILDSDR